MTTKLFFKTVDGKYIELLKPEDMAKARVTKYIKRVPKPSGKGYYYFYTKQQFQEYKDKGIVPKEEKGDSALQKIFKFLGVDNWMDGSKKIGQIYEDNKNSLLNGDIDKKTFAEYSVEYLQNKEKWDKKLSGEKKEKSESKPKSEQPKSEKTEKKESTGKKWNMSIMKTIAGIYGGGKEKSGSEKFKEAAEESKENIQNAKSQKVVNFKGDDTDYHVVDSWEQDGIKLYRVVIDEKIDQFDNT